VNVFYHVGQRHAGDAFAIGSIGLADSAGILCAALLAVPVELALCAAQVARGNDVCRTL
jgi:battenin